LIATIENHLNAGTSQPTPRQPTRLDRVLTDRLMLDDSALMNDMLQLFLQLAPERLEKLETAADLSDTETVEREAKMIGAAAKQLASSGLGECARRLEQAAARGDFGQVKRDLQTLRQEIRSLDALTT
jgi:HPt (histidine-containing phosphotransfer) domain-containing protein